MSGHSPLLLRVTGQAGKDQRDHDRQSTDEPVGRPAPRIAVVMGTSAMRPRAKRLSQSAQGSARQGALASDLSMSADCAAVEVVYKPGPAAARAVHGATAQGPLERRHRCASPVGLRGAAGAHRRAAGADPAAAMQANGR